MRTNPVKQRISSGGVAWGTFVFEFNSTGIARLAAEAGAEFLIFDMEHTGWSVETIRMLIATTPRTTVPMVRIPATDYHFVARTLDMGARGVMAPMVESAAQARQLVWAAKYPPQGRRGAAFGVAHDDYQAGGDVAGKMEQANQEVLLIAQIETAAGLEQAEEIASIDGIDVLWIGHFDLTASLGIPGQFEHPSFLKAVERVSRACHDHGKTAGFMSSGAADALPRLKQGFRIQAIGGDLWLYQQALANQLQQIKSQSS